MTDTDSSVWCLKKALEGLKDSAQLTSLTTEVRSQFLSATGALRAIISKLNADDEKSGNSNGLTGFIRIFRDNATLDVISVLTFGARSDAYEVRSNSLLILANVIDNSWITYGTRILGSSIKRKIIRFGGVRTYSRSYPSWLRGLTRRIS